MSAAMGVLHYTKPSCGVRRRVEPSCSAIPPDWWRGGHIRRTYSSAPPEAGRGVTTSINQTFCKAPCMANMKITMIVLLRAWNSHE